GFAVDLAVADDLAPRRAEPWPHHRRGGRPSPRPPFLPGGRRFLAVLHHAREVSLPFVRFLPCRPGHPCRGDRAVVRDPDRHGCRKSALILATIACGETAHFAVI